MISPWESGFLWLRAISKDRLSTVSHWPDLRLGGRRPLSSFDICAYTTASTKMLSLKIPQHHILLLHVQKTSFHPGFPLCFLNSFNQSSEYSYLPSVFTSLWNILQVFMSKWNDEFSWVCWGLSQFQTWNFSVPDKLGTIGHLIENQSVEFQQLAFPFLYQVTKWQKSLGSQRSLCLGVQDKGWWTLTP